MKTDDAGHPTFVDSPDHRRYGVILKVENAPPDAYVATFELDPSTHYDPVHTSRLEPDGGFSLDTTTTGDFPVAVRLHRSKGEDLVLKDNIAAARDTRTPQAMALLRSPRPCRTSLNIDPR